MCEEAVQLAAGGVHRSLLFLRAVVYRRPAVLVDSIPKKPLCGFLPERGIVVQVADNLAAQRP